MMETNHFWQKVSGRVVAMLVLLLAFAAVTGSSATESVPRSMQSRARADMRSLSTAVESYRCDYNAYPPSLGDLLTSPTTYVSNIPLDPFRLNRAAANPAYGFLWIVTLIPPILVGCYVGRRVARREKGILSAIMGFLYGFCAFVVALVAMTAMTFGLLDPFHDHGIRLVPNSSWPIDEKGFDYATDGTTWYLFQSVGPDGDRDFVAARAMDGYSRATATPDERCTLARMISANTYDGTNGTLSSGDIFWVNRDFW